MTKRRNGFKSLKGLSVFLMSTSLLPLTPIHAEEASQETEAEEIVEELENTESSETQFMMSVSQTSNGKTGWSQEGSNRYYYDDAGEKVTGWQKIDGHWYYMNASGAMQTGWQTIGANEYYMNGDGIMQTGYLVIGSQMYYFKPNGALDTSLEDLNKNPTPTEFIDTVSDYAIKIAEEHGLYASVIVAQASLETGYGRSALSKVPNHNLFGIKGAYNGESVYMYTQEDDGKGNMSTIQANFRKYPSYLESFEDYADKIVNGVSWKPDIYTGTWRANTNNYSDATAALTGVYATDTSYYRKLNNIIQHYRLYELDGDTLVTNPSLPKGWQKVDDNWYYIGKNGYKHTGWQIINDRSYYMDSNGVMQTGWVSSGGETYFMNSTGTLRTNAWVKDNENYYYMGNDGEMQTGWIKVKDVSYYLDNNGVMQTGWVNSNGKTYYMNSNGSMRIGWVKENDTYYYMGSDGVMQTGWIEVRGKSYYLDSKGMMQTGWVQIDNQWYHFNESGADDISSPNGGILHEHTAKRLEGPRRVETALQVSREVYPDNSAKNVVLAGYSGEADALTGTLLASAKEAPLLLVNQFNDIKRELIRLGTENVYLLGGKSAISSAVEDELRAANYNVVRVAGDDRFETAVAVAKASKANTDHVFLTNDGRSGSLADALAVGSVSGRDQAPILLTGKKELPKQTLVAIKEMKVKKITIVGGETVISEDIQEELEAENIQVNRIAGETRWETAEKIANTYFSNSKKAIVTNDGRVSFADALMGGYLGAKENAPILLTAADQLNAITKDYLKTSATSAYILGGEAVVQKENFEAIEKVVK